MYYSSFLWQCFCQSLCVQLIRTFYIVFKVLLQEFFVDYCDGAINMDIFSNHRNRLFWNKHLKYHDEHNQIILKPNYLYRMILVTGWSFKWTSMKMWRQKIKTSFVTIETARGNIFITRDFNGRVRIRVPRYQGVR